MQKSEDKQQPVKNNLSNQYDQFQLDNASKVIAQGNLQPKHGKIVPVAPDGFCAIHALKHFGVTTIHSLSAQRLADGWLTEDEISLICREYNWSWTKHNHSVPEQTFNTGTLKHINLDWEGINTDQGHWNPIICECDRATATKVQSYIGQYKNIPICTGNLYINCANKDLTDGAGQALDFANMFPNYSVKIKTPVPTNLLPNIIIIIN